MWTRQARFTTGLIADCWSGAWCGAGRPIPDLGEPFDENWWVRRWLRRERLGEVEALTPAEQARAMYFSMRHPSLTRGREPGGAT